MCFFSSKANDVSMTMEISQKNTHEIPRNHTHNMQKLPSSRYLSYGLKKSSYPKNYEQASAHDITTI